MQNRGTRTTCWKTWQKETFASRVKYSIGRKTSKTRKWQCTFPNHELTAIMSFCQASSRLQVHACVKRNSWWVYESINLLQNNKIICFLACKHNFMKVDWTRIKLQPSNFTWPTSSNVSDHDDNNYFGQPKLQFTLSHVQFGIEYCHKWYRK